MKIKQSVDIQLEDNENQFSDQFQTCTVLYKHKNQDIINQSIKNELIKHKSLKMRAKMVFESNLSQILVYFPEIIQNDPIFGFFFALMRQKIG